MRDAQKALIIIINVYAPGSTKNFEKYERFMQTLKQVCSRRYFVAGDLGEELGLLLCREEDDDPKEIYEPQCWYGAEADPGE